METLQAQKLARKKQPNNQNNRRDPFQSRSRHDNDDDDDDDDWNNDDDNNGVTIKGDNEFIPAKLSRRILDEAREQQIEEQDNPDVTTSIAPKKKRVNFGKTENNTSSAGLPGGRLTRTHRSNMDDDEEDENDEDAQIIDFNDNDDIALEGEYVTLATGDEELDKEDAQILKRFMPEDNTERKTLADIIMAKLAEKEAQDEEETGIPTNTGSSHIISSGNGVRIPGQGLDPKVIDVYTEVGKLLSHYKSGKMPKVMKIVPSLPAWEDVTFLTNPETWTPHATYAVTRIFASNMNPAKAQRFYNAVLLPKCRDDIYLHKRLNFHLYLALKKATYKPAAFYKGIILPLAMGGDCTLREAIIFGSIISKASIPQLHSAAALIKIATMEYTGAISIFLRILINKKYTLPYMAIDILVDHFLNFENITGPLPLIWHQALLGLTQRYKADLTFEQKEQLRHLVSIHNHYAVTPEIRREMASVGCRGDPVTVIPSSNSSGHNNTMNETVQQNTNYNKHLSSSSSSKNPITNKASNLYRSGDDLDF